MKKKDNILSHLTLSSLIENPFLSSRFFLTFHYQPTQKTYTAFTTSHM